MPFGNIAAKYDNVGADHGIVRDDPVDGVEHYRPALRRLDRGRKRAGNPERAMLMWAEGAGHHRDRDAVPKFPIAWPLLIVGGRIVRDIAQAIHARHLVPRPLPNAGTGTPSCSGLPSRCLPRP